LYVYCNIHIILWLFGYILPHYMAPSCRCYIIIHTKIYRQMKLQLDNPHQEGQQRFQWKQTIQPYVPYNDIWLWCKRFCTLMHTNWLILWALLQDNPGVLVD